VYGSLRSKGASLTVSAKEVGDVQAATCPDLTSYFVFTHEKDTQRPELSAAKKTGQEILRRCVGYVGSSKAIKVLLFEKTEELKSGKKVGTLRMHEGPYNKKQIRKKPRPLSRGGHVVSFSSCTEVLKNLKMDGVSSMNEVGVRHSLTIETLVDDKV
jgi:hypothetical protein